MKNEELVIKALETDKYKWRTINGIAKECGMPADEVRNIIRSLGDKIIKGSETSEMGEELYTTRERYYTKRDFFTRLLTAVSGSVK
jgi:hypothetical protein